MDADNAIEYTDPTYYDFFIQSSTEIVNFWNKLEPERTASLWRHYTIHPSPPDDQEYWSSWNIFLRRVKFPFWYNVFECCFKLAFSFIGLCKSIFIWNWYWTSPKTYWMAGSSDDKNPQLHSIRSRKITFFYPQCTSLQVKYYYLFKNIYQIFLSVHSLYGSVSLCSNMIIFLILPPVFGIGIKPNFNQHPQTWDGSMLLFLDGTSRLYSSVQW